MSKFIIIGCPRSGTGYASKFFNLGHEKFNKNGISSWCLVKNPPLYGPSLKETQLKFPKVPIYHQIRNPTDTISSFLSMQERAWKYFNIQLELDSNTSKLKRGMEIYYKWNQLAKNVADFTYPLEKIEIVFPHIKPFSNKKENMRPHSNYTEKNFLQEDKELWSKIKELYGKETSNTQRDTE